MMAALRPLARDDSGSATIELALILPVFAAFLMGAADVAMAVGRKLVLEQAAQRGIEKIMQTTADNTVDMTILSEAADAAGVPNTSDYVQVSYFHECDGKTVAYTTECTTGQSSRRYITLTVRDTYYPQFLTTFPLNGDGVALRAQAGIRTN